jgi:hypothetical protein
MPSSERCNETRPEEAAPGYHRVVRFASKQAARRAYFQVQETIFDADDELELGAFNLLMSLIAHVAVLGEEPPPEVDQQLGTILAAGEAPSLPPAVLKKLNARRMEAGSHGAWVERHYRPGETLP